MTNNTFELITPKAYKPESITKIGFGECPPELGLVAAAEWDRIVRELSDTMILTNLDRAAFAGYCGSYWLWLEAMDNIRVHGTLMKTQSGWPSPSPFIAIANQQFDIMWKIAQAFGFTPASRLRIPAYRRNDDIDHPQLQPWTSEDFEPQAGD